MPKRSAYTLLEMLLVIVVAAILLLVTVPAVQSSLDSQKLQAATTRLAGDLSLAGQLAVTEGRTVLFQFRAPPGPEAPDSPDMLRGWQAGVADRISAAFQPTGEPVWLEDGLVFVMHGDFSSLLTRPRAAEEPCEIAFKPGGDTSLPRDAAQRWCITLALERDVQRLGPGTLPPHSRTLVLNAHTGAVTVY